MKITNKRWAEAQKAERKCHDNFLDKAGVEGVRMHYKKVYEMYFKYLQIDPEQMKGKTIIEIGCADFPALEWIEPSQGILVEPLPSDTLHELVSTREDLVIVQDKMETATLPTVDEIWLMNVLQHVQDPDLFLNRCKELGKVVRFFEPIDWPIEVHHPHSFTFEYYQGHFGDCTLLYGGERRDFHTAKCAYGIWEK